MIHVIRQYDGELHIWHGYDAERKQLAEDDFGDDKIEPTMILNREDANELIVQALRGPMGPVGPVGPMGERGQDG